MTTKNALTPIGQICQALDKMEPSLNESLEGTGISTKRFLAVAKTAIQSHPQKDKLAGADRGSLFLAVKNASSDGLMPDGREAALVVYGDKVQYQPMVQGLVKLARKSGEIESINSEVVYEGDEFELYHDFDGVKFKHVPNWKGQRGAPILVWASVKLKSGERMARAYPKERIMQIASRSKMSANYDPVKGKDWEEFWRKAAIRNILKYAPKSTDLDKALEKDNAEFVESVDADGVVTQTPVTQTVKAEPKKRETKASQVVKESMEPKDEIIDLEPTDVGVVVDGASEISEEVSEEEIPV